ncbi:MAG: F0F1 ATP synthase subunit A [Bacteroidales bacterium]|nr:F0F1 ATP synthase subunit A [Bacteroidales bacterium]
MRKLILLITSFLLMASTQNSQAQSEAPADSTAGGEEGINMTDVIGHHISDAHSWSIFAYTNSEGEEVECKISLPVMAYYDGQFLFTLSSSFDDGATVEKGVNTYYLKHEKLYVRNGSGEEVRPFDFSITRNVVSMFISVAILLLLFVGAARSYKNSLVPRGKASLAEMLVLFVKDIADEQIGRRKSARYVPYLLTLFYFIWFNNLIGLVPFFPGSSNLSGNIAFTSILAVFTFIVTNFNGTRHYWKHTLVMPGVPFLMKIILVPIEIITLFTRPFTLMIRLFANVTGGHIIIISLISMIFIMKTYVMVAPSMLLALMIFVLELIFGALQAYIFTLLSALYIGLAVDDGHEEQTA